MHDPLPIDRLRSALRAWGLETADVVSIVPGATSDVFLVMRGHERWVAKFNYDAPEYFEVGLRASQIVRRRVASDSIAVAVPEPTSRGTLTELVSWPEGELNPLAVLTYVGGDPLPIADTPSARLVGEVCGRVHAALLPVPPEEVGIVELPTEPDGNYPDRDAGEFSWLHGLWRELEQRAWDSRADVRHGVAVWDGPDIRRRPDGISLLDFGHCGWHPIVHVVANRSLNVSLADESLLRPFLESVERHLPLTPREIEHFALHRLRNIAIYARWVAMERVARHDPTFNDRWFLQLLRALDRELPAIGLTPSASTGSPAPGA